MSEPAKQPTAAPEQGSGPQGPQPSEPQAAAWPGLGQVLAGLAGVGVLVTGGAFLMGWAYTTAFYDRLGIPTRALHLQPVDYVTAKMEIWHVLVIVALSSSFIMLQIVSASRLALVAHGLTAIARGPWKRPAVSKPGPAARPETWALFLASAALLALMVGSLGLGRTGEAAFLYASALGVPLGCLALWWALRITRRPVRVGLTSFVAGLLLTFALFFLLVVPEVLGHHDAEALLAGPEEGRGARFVAAEPLGLPGERYESSVYVTESVGVVRATDNAYFVVVRGTKTVYSLPAARVLRVEYTPHEGR